jgi:hypothetical protein
MSLDNDNRPNGWIATPGIGYLPEPVSQDVKDLASEHPDYMWDRINKMLVAPLQPAVTDVQRTPEEIIDHLVQVLTDFIIAKCQEKRYDGPTSFPQYVATTPDPASPTYEIEMRYKQESISMLAWIPKVWATAELLQNQVESGSASVPTDAELIALMPAAPW